ncbi:GntR family transcriptional repressor for pyruvate dehydrogenase complex [Desulfitispora alkaliphila]|uniref:FadR/GntR family transcriptional regulator n=1 Tax=Desulfitispora alkaliphila TaxID=622674 RepID=UPI003D21E158
MDLKPVKTRRIYEQIVDQIKSLITQGNLHPGDKLLSERELAEHLCVSRASVREALRSLEIMGLLEIKPGEGTYIRKADINTVVEPLVLMFLLEQDKTRELLEVRKGLEVEAVGLAAERALEEDLFSLERALQQMEQGLDISGNAGEKADLKFHFAIAEASHNSILIRLMNTVHDSMNQTLKTTRQLWISNTDGTAERLYEEHRAIYMAIKNKHIEKARQIMYEHLIKVEQELCKIRANS